MGRQESCDSPGSHILTKFEVIAMKKEILACMKCGSSDLDANPGGVYAAQTEMGMSGAVSGQVRCRKCGSFGFPLEFDNEKTRMQYVKSKSSKR